jgi:GNAT superfamily N-acetyltransferase
VTEFRSASEADVPGEYAVFCAAQQELHERRGTPWPSPPFDPSGMWAEMHRHLLAHDGERAFVAEQDGRIVGFTAALVRGDCWFFSALFVAPEFQSQGLGRRLLELAWGGPYRRRMTISQAIQPVSTGLYARRGLLPVTPVLGFDGTPSLGKRDDALEPSDPTPEALRAIDLAAYGFDRAVDHEFWARTSATARVWLRDGQPCAYSYRRGSFGGHCTGPVAGVDSHTAALALRAELAAHPDEETRIEIPGTATALVQTALDAGLRLTDPDLLLLSPPEHPPTAYAIHSSWLL